MDGLLEMWMDIVATYFESKFALKRFDKNIPLLRAQRCQEGAAEGGAMGICFHKILKT